MAPRRSPSDPAADPAEHLIDDPDRAPQIPSIWDVAEDDDRQKDDTAGFLPEEDPFAPPLPMAARRPDWLAPEMWLRAEGGAGRALAEAAGATARLDERLRRAPDAIRLAWRERLALEDISALLWAEGIRLRPETLALADADRLGRAEDEGQVMARGLWARRRLTGQGAVPGSGDDIPRFLGRVPRAAEDPLRAAPAVEAAWGGSWADLPEALIPPGPDAGTAERWGQAMAGLAGAHPLTQSAAAFHLWRGLGLSGPDAWLEPGVVAARVAAGLARGGLSSVPLTAGAERALVRQGTAGERLETWLGGLTRAADHAQMTLDRIESWQTRALDRATGMKGKGAPALIALLAARPVVSARGVAEALEISGVQARTLLNRLHGLGLIRELTGHTRFRFWTAAT